MQISGSFEKHMPGAKGAGVFLHEIRPLLHIKSDTVFVPPTYFASSQGAPGCAALTLEAVFFDLEAAGQTLR